MPLHAHNTVLINQIAVNLSVFGMNMDEARVELADGADIINMLPNEVRWIKIQAEMVARNSREHAPPDVRRNVDVILAHEALHAFGIGLRKIIYINVRHSGIAALGLAYRPATDFQTIEALVSSKLHMLFKRPIRQNRRDISELHT